MKKLITNTLCAIFALVLVSCASTGDVSKVNAKKPTSVKGGVKAEYLDWQGAAVGADIPEWVVEVTNAGSEEDVAKLVKKDPSKYRVFTIIDNGPNLDALKLLIDNFDIQVRVGQSIRQNVAQVATRVQEGEGKIADPEVTEQVVNMINLNLDLAALERVTSYWTQYQMVDKKGKVTKAPQYSYIVVMAMETDRFNAQLDAAMKNLDDYTSESSYLRQLSSLVITQLRGQGSLVQGEIELDMKIGDR